MVGSARFSPAVEGSAAVRGCVTECRNVRSSARASCYPACQIATARVACGTALCFLLTARYTVLLFVTAVLDREKKLVRTPRVEGGA